MILPLALISTFLVNSAAAHTIFRELTVNGVAQGVNKGIRVPSYNGPVTDVTTNSIICNGPPNPLITPYDQTIINVPAGATVAASFYHSEGYPIDPSHKGPIMAYLAKVNSALQEDVTGLKWFKIYEDGLHSDGTWAVDTMLANGGKTSFTIPSCIPPGNYFLRVELIALHGAGTYPGAQFYMECAQINVTGGGSASPATVSFPGAYSGSDPGITVKQVYFITRFSLILTSIATFWDRLASTTHPVSTSYL
ncbi:glycoside hydrolase [Serendipita vermifera]|nr:glycoside hydrolase [Serendipita vermifera]